MPAQRPDTGTAAATTTATAAVVLLGMLLLLLLPESGRAGNVVNIATVDDCMACDSITALLKLSMQREQTRQSVPNTGHQDVTARTKTTQQ